MSSLDGRIAIVTGAGAGLGREHALLLAAHGASVVVNDISADAAQPVVDEITASGGNAIGCPADVTSWAGAGALVEAAVSTYGDLHVLVNNAGIVRDGMIVNLTEDNWDRVVGVHLKGHAATIHHAAVHWRARQKAGESVNASIISTASRSRTFTSAAFRNGP